MDRGPPLVLLIGLGVFLAVVILVYSALMGTLAVTQRVFNSTNDYNPLKKDIYPAYFSLDKLRYYDRVLAESVINESPTDPDNESVGDSSTPAVLVPILDRCNMSLPKETLIVDLLISSQRHPDNCEVFIDKHIVKSFSLESLKRMKNSSDGLILYSEAIQNVDIYQSHLVMICCDELCREDTINPLCKKRSSE